LEVTFGFYKGRRRFIRASMSTLFKRRHIREVAPEVIPPGHREPDAEDVQVHATAAMEEQPQAPVEPLARRVEPHHFVVCEIRFWRGWRKGMFYAGMTEDGEEVAVAESAAFPLAGANAVPARTDAAVAAHDGLKAALEAAGWEHVAGGATWYGGTWRRATAAGEPAPARTPL
jgi:hypothetical protein